MRVILNGEHAMNCNLAVAWIESCAFVNCLRHELCLTAHWLQFNSWSEARNHGGANSWCVSINSFIKTNRVRMRVILNGEHAMNCNLAVAWIESCAFVNCLRHELCLTAHWLQFNSWSEARNHGVANSWCVSINSFIKTNRARIEGFVSLYSCSLSIV